MCGILPWAHNGKMCDVEGVVSHTPMASVLVKIL